MRLQDFPWPGYIKNSKEIPVMVPSLLEHILHLLIISPLVFLSVKNKKRGTWEIILVFTIYFLVRSFLLHLPFEFQHVNFITGHWNWSGKIMAVGSSVLFLIVYRKFKLNDYFLTFKQNPVFLKKGVAIVALLLIIGSVTSYIYSTPKEWNLETILFQLTMPGIDEEIAYRGIMMGLLTQVLKPGIRLSKHLQFNPSILITAILFGFAHGFFITDSYSIVFKVYPVLRTMILGYIWGWITIKSGSVLLALISHNLGNVSDQFIRMR